MFNVKYNALLYVWLAVFVCAGGAYVKANDSAPVLYLTFDELQNEKVLDSSMRHNECVIKGAPSWSPAVKGFGFEFNGSDDTVVCASTPHLHPDKQVTVETWVKMKQALSEYDNVVLFSPDDVHLSIAGGPEAPKWRFYVFNTEDKFAAAVADNLIVPDRWYHVAGVYDGQSAKLYVNGALQTATGALTGKIRNAGDDLLIGSFLPTRPFNGAMDELRVYDRALTAEEIKRHFNDESAPGIKACIINGTKLIDKGVAQAFIVADPAAPRITRFAVDEFRQYFRKIFSVTMPLSWSDGATNQCFKFSGDCPAIFIGESKNARAAGFPSAPQAGDGFLISSRSNNLAIMGQDDHRTRPIPSYCSPFAGAGTLYGVYRLLEEIGVRWYFPGEQGEVIPNNDSFRIELELVDRPYFIYRYAGVGIADGLWTRRIGFGGTVYPASTVHSFSDWGGKYRLIYPQFFARCSDGTTNLQELCWYAPGVRERMIQDTEGFFAKSDPDIYPDFTFMRSDGAKACCACAECQKRKTPEEGWYGELSDYVMEAALETSAAIRTNYPDRRIVIGAYEQITRPPVKIKELPANMAVHIFKHRLILWDDEVRRRLYDEIIGGWLKLKPCAVSFWEYYNCDEWGPSWYGLPVMTPHMIAADIRKIKNMAEKSGTPFLGEWIYCGGNKGAGEAKRMYWLAPALYVTAKLLWHPETPVDALMDDFYKKYFGPAAPEMKKFYERLESVWSAGGWRKNNYGARMSMDDIKKDAAKYEKNAWQTAFTPEVLRAACDDLNRARQAADGNPYKEHVEYIASCFTFTLEQAGKNGGNKVSIEELEKGLKYYGGK